MEDHTLPGLAVTYQCSDKNLGFGNMSLYDACTSRLALTEAIYRAGPLIIALENLPALLVIQELHCGLKRHNLLTAVGDIFALVLLVIMLLSAAICAAPGTQSRRFTIATTVDLLGGTAVTLSLLCYSYDAMKRDVLRLAGHVERYDCFLSHDWGIDEEGRPNHVRVEHVCAKLQASGLSVWFDAEQMAGDINAAMTDGVDRSATVIIFITRNYLRKVAGHGPKGRSDK